MNSLLGSWLGRIAAVAGLAVVGLLNAPTALAQTDPWVVVGPSVAVIMLPTEARRVEEALFGPRQQDPCQATPQTDQTDDQDAAALQVEQRRRLSRSYAVPKTGRAFSLDTRYGRVLINPWNKHEIKVDAELVARSETDAGALQVLDALAVQWLDYDAKTGGVAVSTQFGPALRGRAGGCRYEVNYTIWLPRATALRVYNSFGEVAIAGDLTGPAELAVEYGALRAGRLEGPRNLVRIGNGDCTIAFAGHASINASYARLRLDEGTTVDLRNN